MAARPGTRVVKPMGQQFPGRASLTSGVSGPIAAFGRAVPKRAGLSLARHALVVFLPLALLIGGVGVAFDALSMAHDEEAVAAAEAARVDGQRAAAASTLRGALSDLRVVAAVQPDPHYAEHAGDAPYESVTRQYLAFANAKRTCDQVRYLSSDGHERVRVDLIDGRATPNAELQDKSGRYYFQAAARLAPGVVFISPLDLNVERGAVEVPHKPVIRLATRIVDEADHVDGVVVLNVLGRELLDAITSLAAPEQAETMLLNADGYWLLAPNPADAWGHMLDDPTRSFAHRFPDAWATIEAQERGAFETADGYFTYRTVDVAAAVRGEGFPDADLVTHGPLRWKVVSRVTPAMLSERLGAHRGHLLWALLAALVVAAVLSAIVGRARQRQAHAEARLERLATTDLLTGVPNRRHAVDLFGQQLAHAHRYGCATSLAMIDLDEFKAVNDTHGHAAGDAVLRAFGALLAGVVRETDRIGRVGGEEFAWCMPGTPLSEAQRAAERLRSALSDLEVELPSGEVLAVTMSIGLAEYQLGDTVAGLMARADQALYRAKHRGRDRVEIAA